jgi:ribonuclease HI
VDDLTLWARGDAGEVAEAVAEALAITRAYEEAMDWRLHELKSKQFANNASVRGWLRRQNPSIQVGTSVQDLGVVATAGKGRRAPVPQARLRMASGRFARVRRIPASFRWRCLLGAAAGTQAGLYGAACGRPPAKELEQLRRAARAVACRGQRAAAEVVFGLLSPTWRLDPKAIAVLAPVRQAARALRAGTLPVDVWRATAAAVTAGAGRSVGPVAAALASMMSLGLGEDIESWAGVPDAPHGWRPAEHECCSTERVLLAAWGRAECRKLAARRRDYAHLVHGADRWATRRLLDSGALSAEPAGSLRAVMAGSVVTAAVAAKWSGRPPLCPHCRLADEDLEHRYWMCPAWEARRRAALADAPPEAQAPLDPDDLRRHLSAGVLRTGVMPVHLGLAALASAAACADAGLPPQAALRPEAARATVWTDGACLHPADPLLARAAWGLRAAGLEQCNWAGPVNGAQTAQRAEVTAALAASRLLGGPVDLVSDSRFVVDSCAKIAAGGCARGWAHADIWEQLVPHVRSGRVVARWVPAHKTEAEARCSGVAERDRLGNAAADSNAGAAARARLPREDLLAERRRAIGRLEAAQRVLAAVQLAAHAADRAGRGDQPLRRPRDWRQVRRGARAQAQSALTAMGGEQAREPAPVGAARDAEPDAAAAARARRGEALQAFFAGRSWRPHAPARGPGLVVCLRCGARATARTALADKPCAGWASTLAAQVQGFLLLGELHCAGGSAEEFARLARSRLAQIPRAPD